MSSKVGVGTGAAESIVLLGIALIEVSEGLLGGAVLFRAS